MVTVCQQAATRQTSLEDLLLEVVAWQQGFKLFWQNDCCCCFFFSFVCFVLALHLLTYFFSMNAWCLIVTTTRQLYKLFTLLLRHNWKKGGSKYYLLESEIYFLYIFIIFLEIFKELSRIVPTRTGRKKKKKHINPSQLPKFRNEQAAKHFPL